MLRTIKDNKYLVQLLIVVFGAILFFPLLGHVHLFDWDEINFAESAREMIFSKNYLTVQINYLPFWEKPPLFIWMQVLSMKAFGINEFAARFPNAICGIVTLLVLFNIGKTLKGAKFGLIWVLTYIGSILPFFYFKSGIIDPWFNLFIFAGIYFFIKYIHNQGHWNSVLSAGMIGLAILTKGPVGLLIFGLTIFIILIFKKFRFKISWIDILLYIITLTIVGGFWFILQIFSGNYSIIVDFILYQVALFQTKVAGHGGFLMYHFVVLFFGVLPASIFALTSFRKSRESSFNSLFHLGMKVLFWTVLILFTIVHTKIVHYSSMCYFPLTYLAAWQLYNHIVENKQFPKWQNILLGVITSLIAVAVVLFPVVAIHKTILIDWGLIKDSFSTGNLMADVHWNVFDGYAGVILLVGLVLYYIYSKTNILKAVMSLFIASLLFVFIAMAVFTPKIEGYSQNAAIEFYINKSKEDCYAKPLGFKSYAQYFYFNKKVPKSKLEYSDDWLLKGDIDKPAYFVIKSTKIDRYLKAFPLLKIDYKKNGFVFCSRKLNINYDKQ